MRVLILGAGTVGTSIADLLCRGQHSITVVDSDPSHARRLNEQMDVKVLTGSASESSLLFQAGVIGSDLCLAVTGNDEVNLVAASMAKAMGAGRAIARVFAPIFRDIGTFDYQRHFQIDRLLSLEHLSAMEFARAIRNPGSLAVENFGRGEVEVQEILVHESGPAVDKPLMDISINKGVRIGSIQRDGKTWIAGAHDQIQVGDRITVIGRREDVDAAKQTFHAKTEPWKDVIIAGGGETGFHLARTVENLRCRVTVMEQSDERCEFLASHLKDATVVNADATSRAVLEEERVGSADVFVAATGDDENNIMAGVEAREIGVSTVMAIVSRPDYANVVGKLGIDLAVSPREVMAKQVLGFLHTGPVVSDFRFNRSSLGVMEIEVREGALVTEHVLANLRLPEQCLIAAVNRENYVHVPGADDRLRPGDTVVALVDDEAVEHLTPLFGTNGR